MPLSDYPKTVRLSDGRKLTLRPLRPDDGDRLLRFFQALPAEDRLFFKHDVTQREVIDRWVKTINYDRVLPLLALDGDEVVADGTLHVSAHGWMRHVGEIRLTVAPQSRGRGLGTLIVRDLFARAVELDMGKIQVLAFEDHQPAIRMCAKLGFHQVAVLPDHIKDQRGQKHNLAILVSDVEDLWRQMEDLIQGMDGAFRFDHAPGA